jgi:hypothetical protein
MIKSNSKIFREKVKKYVIDNIDAEASTPIEALQNTLENFSAWYCPFYKKQYPSLINAFIPFFNTGVMDVSIWHDEHRALLKEWFEQTEAEAEKYDNIQVSNKFYYQVAKAFISLCKDYNINIEEDKKMKKYNLYYQNYETKTGTQKEFEKVTEVLSLDDVKPILGTQQDIENFEPKLVKTSGRNGTYYIHQCLIIVDAKDGWIEEIIYKTIDNNGVI